MSTSRGRNRAAFRQTNLVILQIHIEQASN